ncbi:hypothetical protein UlMin_000469 [Ulmus minor]
MRQRRWLELVKDYDCTINYHPGKANVVADALSRKSSSSVASLQLVQKPLLGDIQRLGLEIVPRGDFKAEHQRPSGLLQPLMIPEWKWEHISMDFVMGLPKTLKGYNSIWVIVDRLTKSAHFLPVKNTYKMEQYAKLYVQEIVRLHGIPLSIVSDRDPKFTSTFWKSLHKAMGTRLRFSTAFHPQTDGQSERTIQTLEDMKCRSPIHWDEVGERKLLGPEIVQKTVDIVEKIRQRMKTAQSRQKSYADRRRKPLEFAIGDKVFLKVAPMKGVMRFGKRGKLSPRFVGPFEILERIGDLAYRVALPPAMSGIHNVFHVSILRKYTPDPSHVLSYDTLDLRQDLTFEELPVKILDREEKELRRKKILLVKVLWRNHEVEEATWEREDEMRAKYPHLFGTY